jgi:transposase
MNEPLRNEVIRRHQAGASLRQIARDLGLSRNTVRRVLAGAQAARAGQAAGGAPRRPSQLDAYEAAIRELLGRYPELTAVRLFEELRSRGFTGSYSLVRLRLRQLRPRPAPAPVVRFETAPGAQAQMDYATYDLDFTEEGRRRVHLFSYLLGYSRRQYLRFVEAQDFETTLREHVRAFTYFGGVAATCLYDNFKVVVTAYDGDEPRYNPRFLAFATHYGFRPVACRPRRPQTKGKVERPFYYAQTNLLCGRTFRTLDHLNEVTAGWLREVADVRSHRETGQAPQQRFAQEQPHLIGLPACPYDVAALVYRTVSAEGFIAYRQNLYSVPWPHIGRVLPVRVTEGELIAYSPQVEEIARHPLWPRSVTGQRRVQPEHHPSQARPRHEMLQQRFAELGPAGERFLVGLVQAQRYGKDQAQRVLALLGSYSRADVTAALERAARYGAFSYAAVERILAVQARPKGMLESLGEQGHEHLQPLLEGTPVRPRPVSDYQRLFCEEPDDHDNQAPAPPSDDSAGPA